MGTATFQKVCRELAGTAWQVTGDAHAVCDLYSIPAGDIAARLGARTGLSPANALSILMRASEADVYAYMGSTLNLCFDDGTAVDPRITFTRASAATYVNSAGLIASATTNTPRLDYDPVTLACRGFLMEEARTNLVQRSNELTNAYWTTVSNCAVTPGIADPDGGTSAFTLTATAASMVFGKAETATAGVVYTASMWIRRRTGTGPVYLYSGDNVLIDITSSVTGTWQRLSGSGTATSSTTCRCYVSLPTSGDAVDVCRLQLEAGASMSSYIQTVASQVTRAADVAVMTGTNFSSWFNATQGTFVAEFSRLANASSGRVFTAHDGTSNEQLRLTLSVSTNIRPDFQIIDGGVAVANILGALEVAAGASARAAGAYLVNDVNAAVNGTLGTPDTIAAMPTVTTLSIGTNEAGTASINGHIRRITYYPVKLSSAQLQALSA